MSMSKFVSQADYWKDRAERAEAKLAELEGYEPARLTADEIEVCFDVSDGTRISVGRLIENQVLYKNDLLRAD